MVVASPVIIDVVDSRKLPDRAQAHQMILKTFTRVDEAVFPTRKIWATVGDEFQVVYATLNEALKASALARLLLPEGIDLRYGIGKGEIRTITETDSGPIDDGPGWYRARDALDHATDLQGRGHPWLRTWAIIDSTQNHMNQSITQAHLTTRDHLIWRMTTRERRITAAWLEGKTQQEIARAEKMSQAAISQRLVTCGGRALAHALTALQEG